ncbi:CorA family divalent cation transporter [Nitratifractor salsuginis]|uniref:Mg2 transporter protein CorA family protein n=1 Tax=Nitratifractor salsuginis (strain DSM 16511 / JCM 12458 / E9I37-1) TaxID=749222 RepID=E6X388_NITSE|nr:CorA family divalent cation transporter [Nitratifractor salsuginis]ADV47301.1 Mg2 transporter protein CorA family protein [Nitratifractor salsuginis DSM 16511]
MNKEFAEFLDTLILEDIENPEHPSDFESGHDYAVLILRLPHRGKNGELEVNSLAFLTRQGKCYRYNRDKRDFEAIGTFQDLHRILDETTDRLVREIRQYHVEIDRLEETLYDDHSPRDFMERWITYKKEVSLINRLMFHATLSFELFVHYGKKSKDFDELAYADILEHMTRVRDLSKAAMEKLDNLHDFYRTKVDERMNRNMYWLTIISAIFLPLTLVTGFFGMNTGGLPYTDDPNGTAKVIIVSLILEAVFLVSFLLMMSPRIKRFRRKTPSV